MRVTLKQLIFSSIQRQRVRKIAKEVGIKEIMISGSIGYTVSQYKLMQEVAMRKHEARPYLYNLEYINTFKIAVKVASEIVEKANDSLS